jgi:FAD/FMN-containing dehydrogenase
VTGFTLGGGYGPLNNRFGLASDCIKRARLVIADGSVLDVSESENPDLLWALRGGGGGLGVVTSLTIALHSTPSVLSGMIVWPLASAKEALLETQALLERHPVELSLFTGFMTPPNSEKCFFISLMYTGDRHMGESIVEALSSIDGSSIVDQRWCHFKETFNEENEKAFPKGRCYYATTRTLERISEPVVEMLVEAAYSMSTPTSAIVIHDFHGVPTQVSPGATAFVLRNSHFVVEAIAAWDGGSREEGAVHCKWADDLSSALAVIAIPGGYVSMLSPDDIDRVRLFYGKSLQRLRDVKKQTDPHDLFRSAVGRV